MLVNTAVTVSPVARIDRDPELFNRIDSLEKAVMLLVEQNKKLATTIELQNENHNRKLEAIKLRLEPPKREVREFKVWEPAAKKSPQFSPLKKLWYELINPEMLRAN
jgi:regulator of replication initiation timing